MNKYHKIVTVIDNNYQYKFFNELVEILENIKKYKNLPETTKNWFLKLSNKEKGDFIMDIYNVQLMDIFSELCQLLYSSLGLNNKFFR